MIIGVVSDLPAKQHSPLGLAYSAYSPESGSIEESMDLSEVILESLSAISAELVVKELFLRGDTLPLTIP